MKEERAARTTISPHPEVPRRGLEGRGRVAPVASPVLRGFALWATHLRMRLERGGAIRLERACRACHGTPQRAWQAPRTTISPQEVPRRGLEGRGRVVPVASPVLRGFALWATHLRMRLERGRAIKLERGCAVPAPSALPGAGASRGSRQRGRQAPRTTISPHPEVPRRGLEGRGRVAPVASPILRGFALWATHLRMTLARAHSSTSHPEYRTTSPVSRPPIST
ncbi:UNVERIFIED_ORG: hypothetical protein GGE44_000473 [Rhizobium esperanzae]